MVLVIRCRVMECHTAIVYWCRTLLNWNLYYWSFGVFSSSIFTDGPTQHLYATRWLHSDSKSGIQTLKWDLKTARVSIVSSHSTHRNNMYVLSLVWALFEPSTTHEMFPPSASETLTYFLCIFLCCVMSPLWIVSSVPLACILNFKMIHLRVQR